MITKEQVISEMKKIHDPEIPVNIWDLGLIYTIDIKESDVEIKMSLTSEMCPSARQIPVDVRAGIAKIPGVSNINVEVVWEPKWTPEMISAEGKKILKLDE